MAKEVRLRDKLCALAALIFFMLSFIIRQLDYIWHGFHFTNMIPYRFSFLFSFVLLYMAYRAWTLRHSFKVWQILIAVAAAIALFACSDHVREIGQVSGDEFNDALVFMIYNVVFLLMYAALLIWARCEKKLPEDTDERIIARYEANVNRRRESARSLLIAVIAAEMILNLVNFGLKFTGTSIANYPKGTDYTKSVITYMHEREDDTLFFRAETTHSQTLNDGALNRYNGVSTFTSSANVKMTEFMQNLGYGAKNTYNRYCYEEASPVSDLFLGIKYMIERDGRDRASTYYSSINTFGDTTLLQNNFYLPLGFMTEADLADVIFTGSGNKFRFQNELISVASGLEGEVWKLMGDVTITGEDVTITDQNSSGYCAYEDGMNGATIIYSYTVDTDGFMCVDLNMLKRNNVSLWKNGEPVYSETMSLQQMMAVGDVAVGDVVEVRASCKTSNEKGTITINAAILNEERFRQCYEVLAASTLELITFENTLVEGNISCSRDGLLYTSIPQNGNWSVEVDGVPADIKLVGGAMIGVPLTEGEHQVTFIYHNAAFSIGWKISAACALLFVIFMYADAVRRGSSGKYVKKKETR